MAKKKNFLTPEQRLQEALIPESEWPYQVPKNWCWTNLSMLIQPSKEKTDDFSDSSIKYIGLEHIQKDGRIVDVGTVEGVKSLKNIFHPGQILYGKLRPYLNKHDIVSFDGVCSTDILVFTPTEITTAKYVDYFFNQRSFIEYAISNSKGINLPRVNESVVLDALCPLPPYYEQQRIVDRIECLFAKLDEAKQKAQDVLDGFETWKAAILHKAFTGELTSSWRKEKNIAKGSWKSTTVGSICESIKVGIVIKPAQYYTNAENGTPAFRSANVREGYVEDFDWVYLDQNGMENNPRSIVHTGDVLVVRSGYPGTACVVTPKFDGYNAIDILIAVPDKKIVTSEYLCYYTNSPFGKQAVAQNKRGMAQAHYNVKGYSISAIQVPSLSEQAEIIRILDDLLVKEQQAKEAAESVLEKINLIKKSILARAFRGELGTNDPTEESSVELLKEILEKEG